MQSARQLLLSLFGAGVAFLHSISLFGNAESQDDVQLEVQVPFWIDSSDVHIDIGEQQLRVSVRNTFCFLRTCWISR